MLITRGAMRNSFAISARIRDELNFGGHVSVRTVNKRPQLSLRHRQARWNSSRGHFCWNIRNWKQVHWSDKTLFSLRPVDGRVRVGQHRNCAFHDRIVMGITAIDG